MRELREQLLGIIEKNSRIDLKELAVILGVEEVDVVNELAAMESEGIICGLSLIHICLPPSTSWNWMRI